MRALRGAVWGAVAAGLASACAVGPNFKSPPPPPVSQYTAEPLPVETAKAAVAGGQAQRLVAGLDIPAQWWQVFHSPGLDALIEQGLKNNPNVQAAQAALRVSAETTAAQRGVFFPSVGVDYSATRERNAVGTLAPTLTSGAPVFTLHTAQVDVSYSLDVFGGNRRQVESLAAQEESQRFELEATYLTLSSNVAAAAIQEASLRAQIEASREIVAGERQTLEILRHQQELGSIGQPDVAAQDAALAASESLLAPLEKQLAQQRDLLAVLVGRYPNEAPVQTFEFASLDLPSDLPLSLPSKLVRRRPDVRAAEAELHSATAQVGVAIADMLPQFSITAGAGGAATDIASLLKSGNTFWSAGAAFSQTLLAGGTLLHRKRAADAALDEAGAQYRAVVLAAFQNVADTLYAIRFDAQALQAQLRARDAAAAILAAARRNLELGSTSYLALLNAQQSYQQAVVNLVQAESNRYSDTVALFQALGGGWWNRPGAADGS